MSIETKVEDWLLLAQFCHTHRSFSDVLMDQIAMRRAQAALLCRVFAQEGITQSELADQLAVQGATVTNMVQRMEETGLVTRRRDPRDNRLVRVYLTEEGRNKEHAIVEQFIHGEEMLFAGFTPEEHAASRCMLHRIL